MNWKTTIDPYLREVGLYSSYTLSAKEHIVSQRKPIQDVVRLLRAQGYESPPTFFGIALEATKKHPDTGETHLISLRKVDPEEKTKQWHIHLFKRDGKVDLYSHYEFRPDVKPVAGEDIGEMLGRLAIHYKPEPGVEYIRGSIDTETERGLGLV